MDFGKFFVRCINEDTEEPVEGAFVRISYSGQPEDTIETLRTDQNGVTPTISLTTPPLELSLQPQALQPYSEYTVYVTAEGFESVNVSGNEVLANETAILNVRLFPLSRLNTAQSLVIGDHTLYGDYPPKIAESEIKDVNESGEIVLSRVVIPEYVVVHDGPPSDRSAMDYYVPYKDYIKNVASSEIYATWPQATILANILAIMSFTLNRVYTEWYRNKGYDFTITSSTAYDHKWIYGRNIFENISTAVDSVFTNYLSRPGVIQPILTQYCDGKRVTCPNWMSQWGSKTLGDRGYTAIEILRYYYGGNMFINTSETISGIPSSWPGYNLTIGTSGEKVRTIQSQLNRIAIAYPLLPKIAEDGVYGENTANSVRVFQEIFGLPQTGVVDFRTWYKISEIYVGVSKIAELV